MLFTPTSSSEGEKVVIKAIQSVVTDEGDWVFNATGHLYWSAMEKWDIIPEAKRDRREVIQRAADAYLDSVSTFIFIP